MDDSSSKLVKKAVGSYVKAHKPKKKDVTKKDLAKYRAVNKSKPTATKVRITVGPRYVRVKFNGMPAKKIKCTLNRYGFYWEEMYGCWEYALAYEPCSILDTPEIRKIHLNHKKKAIINYLETRTNLEVEYIK